MKRNIAWATAAFAFSMPAAQAMVLSLHGTGQALIFPYYTTNGGNNTLFLLSNTTERAKAVRVRFREGYDGRGVLDFDVYIPAHGQWSASVGSQGDSSTLATLTTGDNACTVPAFTTIDFSDAAYTGDNTTNGPTGNADGGPTTPDRTREGHFDVFEMGEVTGDAHGSLTAITPVNGTPGDCAAIVGAWGSGGYWTADPTTDLSPPAGGLYGTEYVVDVADGTMYGIDAQAIEGFSSVIQHTAPGATAPDLDTASANADGLVGALVPVDGALLQLEYTHAVDAVSALFMTSALQGDFMRLASLGAMTDWIVTAPTKRYYVDPALAGSTAQPPFDIGFAQNYSSGETTVGGQVTDAWGSSFPYSCSQVAVAAFDHDGVFYPTGQINPGGPICNVGEVCPSENYTNPSLMPCLETSVLTFQVQLDAANLEEPVSAFGSQLLDAKDPGDHVGRSYEGGADVLPGAGSLTIDFTTDANGASVASHALTPASNGDVLVGQPVIGFAASRFMNASVTPGVLANYSGSSAIRATVQCSNGNGACR